ncbi:MAG: glucose-6-phosphate dehydrogenase [Acidobacteriota bacterium]|nr:glucose-6-phosphate dehydrogenase [Acidobacteriota bacterium]
MPVTVEPCLFVVFGGTGDLMSRKLLPALYHLGERGAVHRDCIIVGVGRSADLSDDDFRRQTQEALREAGLDPGNSQAWCGRCVHYRSIHDGRVEQYRTLKAELEALEREHGLPGNRVFYLALPPQAFPATLTGLGESGLNRSAGWTRVVVEKPFGHDVESARQLNDLVHAYFEERQIYRIDHYLGKETVQNLMVFRFANPIFEALWNRDRVDHVQITVAEDLGIEGRAGYYEQAGALRDMVQNHLSQVLCHIAMEVPAAFDAQSVRDEKAKVMRSLAPVDPRDVVRGQYTRGAVADTGIPGYREEPGVRSNSATETFVAMRLQVENWRWKGVPFYLRTGKRLPRRVSRIFVTFKSAPVSLFQPFTSSLAPNVLAITLQPDEGFDLRFEVKQPGQPLGIGTQQLHFRYADAFSPLPDGYETLLLDILGGDQTLFVRADWVEASWERYHAALDAPPPLEFYEAGTWGPHGADLLLRQDGRAWLPL